MLAGLVFCEMLSQYPQSAFQGSLRVAGGGGGQQQFATQTIRVHLLGLEKTLACRTGFWPFLFFQAILPESSYNRWL